MAILKARAHIGASGFGSRLSISSGSSTAWPSTAPESSGEGRYAQTASRKRLHAFVLERRTADHRVDLHGERSLADGCLDLLYGDCRGVVEIFLHESLVEFSEGLEHLVSPFLSLLHEVGGNFVHLIFGAHGLVVPEDGLHLHEVHHAFESLLCSDRNLDGERRRAQHFAHLAHHLEEVGARAVHLVDVADTGNVVFVSLTPYGLALGLHAAYGAECGHGSVEHTQRTLHLYGEVHVPRSVNQVDFIFIVIIVPESGGGGGGDGDASLLLLLHPVHRGGSVVHLADLVGQAGVERMRSDVVVLPASMWAMMPMFLVNLRSSCLAMT